MTVASLAAPIILVLVYGGVAIGRIPGLRLDRAGIAFLGGAAMIALGGVSLDEAFRAIDFDTIALLLGMMIVVAHLKVSGAFRALGALAIEHAHAPLALLIATTLLAGVLSAFLVNDAICLVMAPIVLAGDARARPQSAALSGRDRDGVELRQRGDDHRQSAEHGDRRAVAAFPIRPLRPRSRRSPPSASSLVVVVVRLVYREEFASGASCSIRMSCATTSHPGQMLKASLTCVALAIAFFAGVRPAEAAIIGGAFLLLTRALKPARIYRELDGPLLILFAGLFVVVAGAERALLTPDVVASVQWLGLADPWRLSALVAVLSNIVSNVPAVLALKPFIPPLADAHRAWLVVAMSSTLAGNFTLIGSVANLIVAEQARAAGTPIGFFAYFKVGLPLTLVTLAFGTAWLAWT